VPLFDYCCVDCNHREEVLVQFRSLESDPVTKVCPKCDGVMEKELAKPAAVFFNGVISSCSMKGQSNASS